MYSTFVSNDILIGDKTTIAKSIYKTNMYFCLLYTTRIADCWGYEFNRRMCCEHNRLSLNVYFACWLMNSLDALVDEQRGRCIELYADAERVDQTAVRHTDDAASRCVDVQSSSEHTVRLARLLGVQLVPVTRWRSTFTARQLRFSSHALTHRPRWFYCISHINNPNFPSIIDVIYWLISFLDFSLLQFA